MKYEGVLLRGHVVQWFFFGNLFDGLASAFGSEFTTWYCDGCGCEMNSQEGFTTTTGTWKCAEWGYQNDVSNANIYSSEEYQEKMGIPQCPHCGGKVKGDALDATYWFNCQTCGTRFCLENGELVSPFNRNLGKRSKSCVNCGNSLAGGEHTLPWEEGNNEDGYTKCPHCGYVNFNWKF